MERNSPKIYKSREPNLVGARFDDLGRKRAIIQITIWYKYTLVQIRICEALQGNLATFSYFCLTNCLNGVDTKIVLENFGAVHVRIHSLIHSIAYTATF